MDQRLFTAHLRRALIETIASESYINWTTHGVVADRFAPQVSVVITIPPWANEGSAVGIYFVSTISVNCQEVMADFSTTYGHEYSFRTIYLDNVNVSGRQAMYAGLYIVKNGDATRLVLRVVN